MAKALTHSDSEPDDQDETDDIFGELRKKEIDRFFAKKLQAFLSGDVKPENSQTNQSQVFKAADIEKELLNFMNDFQTYKNSDEKSVTSDDTDSRYESSDSESESDSDETYNDDASVVIEGESGFSRQELDLIEKLTGSKAEEKKKKLSLLDLGEDELNEELQKEQDFLLDFQSEVNQAEEKSSGRKNKIVRCYHCDGSFEIVGNYQKSLREHQKEKSHIEKAKEKRLNKNMSSTQSECSSVVGIANLPKYITTSNDGELGCEVCNGRVIGRTRQQFLMHIQCEEHRDNMKNRFDKPKNEVNKNIEEKTNKTQNHKPKKEANKKEKKSKDEEKKKDPKKEDKLITYALGLACIKPLPDNKDQWECKLCNKIIPVAKDHGNLMRNIAQHIQGEVHKKKSQELESSVKEIKEKPEVQKAKKKLKDGVYKFICIPCERDGYGYEFCKSHLASAAHKSKIYKLVEMKTPANFHNGVKCGGCLKYIFGANVDINKHCTDCIKENGFKDKRRRRRQERFQKDKGPENEKGPRTRRERRGRGKNERNNDNGPRSSNNEGRGNRKPHEQRPNQAYRYEKKSTQNVEADIGGQILNAVAEKVAGMFVSPSQGNQYQYPQNNFSQPPPSYSQHQANNYQFPPSQQRVPYASGVRDGFVYVNQAPGNQPPAYQPPNYQAPAHRPPAYQAPVNQAPPYQPPVNQAPAYRPPASQAPAHQASANQAPAYRFPSNQAPANRAPANPASTYRVPSYPVISKPQKKKEESCVIS